MWANIDFLPPFSSQWERTLHVGQKCLRGGPHFPPKRNFSLSTIVGVPLRPKITYESPRPPFPKWNNAKCQNWSKFQYSLSETLSRNITIRTTGLVMYDLKGDYAWVSWWWFSILVWYSFFCSGITNITSDVVTINMNIQYRLRGSCGYESSAFYFMYMDLIKDSCVYTRKLI